MWTSFNPFFRPRYLFVGNLLVLFGNLLVLVGNRIALEENMICQAVQILRRSRVDLHPGDLRYGRGLLG